MYKASKITNGSFINSQRLFTSHFEKSANHSTFSSGCSLGTNIDTTYSQKLNGDFENQ